MDPATGFKAKGWARICLSRFCRDPSRRRLEVFGGDRRRLCARPSTDLRGSACFKVGGQRRGRRSAVNACFASRSIWERSQRFKRALSGALVAPFHRSVFSAVRTAGEQRPTPASIVPYEYVVFAASCCRASNWHCRPNPVVGGAATNSPRGLRFIISPTRRPHALGHHGIKAGRSRAEDLDEYHDFRRLAFTAPQSFRR